MRTLYAIVLVSLAAAATAAEPEVKSNPVKAGGFAVVSYKLDEGESLLWKVTPQPVEIEQFTVDGVAKLHFSGDAEAYQAEAWIVNFSTKRQYIKTVNVSFAQSPKPPPVPPGPIDPPVPPKPVGENPFGELAGLHVMIVYEVKEETRYPLSQYLVLRGKKFRDYVDSKCVEDGYRMFDKDVKPTMPGQWFEPALKRTDRKSLPWLYVGNGKTGYSGPLPLDAEKTIDIISKYEDK